MRMINSNRCIAKVLVYLAVALMPWDLSFAFGCSCSGEATGSHRAKSCCGTAGCNCHHAATPAKRSCCSRRQAAIQTASHAENGGSVQCTCHSQSQPEPQTPSNNSPNQKEQLVAGPANVTPLLALPAADAIFLSGVHSSSYPLSALERCGALCRFLI
jgi:hypothetical protein